MIKEINKSFVLITKKLITFEFDVACYNIL